VVIDSFVKEYWRREGSPWHVDVLDGGEIGGFLECGGFGL